MKLESYKVNLKHRSQKPKKDCTQWIVSEWQELRLFIEAEANNWVCKKNCLWGISKNNDGLIPLGKTDTSDVYMAKYITNINNEWHGYPVSPAREADRPPTTILDSWIDKGFINKAKSRKIIKGYFQ